ncbi:MAG TPA: type II CRISPR RNA-guided endonuclease Cas9, partial [bacterium]|nr:type II CRISPR RNA-guided endonuclease Cas9 [bacterium]
MKNKEKKKGHLLGLDIGANSVGWALIETDDDEPVRLIKTGVRVFDAGVEGDIESAKDVSRAAARREARLRRRLLDRRTRRHKKLALALQRAGLLPEGDVSTAVLRKQFFDKLDAGLSAGDDPAVSPYAFRTRALDEKLKPFEIGRALYHLAHRRGFLSNRKSQLKKDEEEGIIKQKIAGLAAKIGESGCRTLGEYLARLDPEQERIRARYLSRAMIETEFKAIWAAQKKHHPGLLTPEAEKEIHRVIFFQRPLKSAAGNVGRCELEPRCRRAQLAILPAQSFRLLQKVNDIKVTITNRETGEIITRSLTPDERKLLVDKLETQGEMSFPAVRKLLNFKKSDKCEFNFEESGEKALIGNKTASRLISVFGEEEWLKKTDAERTEIVEAMLCTRKDEALARKGLKKWGLSAEAAEKLGSTSLEEGRSAHSLRALEKLLPLMREGVQYATARKQRYGALAFEKVFDALPPLCLPPNSGASVFIDASSNPAVRRALNELRKVVNAVIREYGKPDEIRVELARDLKRSRKERDEIWKANNNRRREREKAAGRLLEEGLKKEPSRTDIEKWLLFEECGGICPYTGKPISFESLFGPSPQFDVEHIVPFSRCLDNSFLNKTLCHNEENRNVKKNKTPWEAYHGTGKWDEIIQRVGKFKGDRKTVEAKRRRFAMEKVEGIDEFATRQLNDTRYATQLAMRYLGLLYGAGVQGVDPSRRRRVQAARGQITA